MGVPDGKRGRAAGAIAAIALSLSLVPVASAYPPGTSQDFFGVNASYLRKLAFPDQPDLVARMNASAASMGQSGISWARVMLDQSVEERDRGVFDWTAPDMIEAALARHGVRGLGMFVGTATWAQEPGIMFQLNGCGSRAYPYDYQAWADWTAAAVRRYGPNGTFWAAHPELPKLPIQTWEVGNEPNLSIFWCPKANPEAYALVYSAVANKILAIDPGATVAVGGLAPNWGTVRANDVDADEFVARMVASDPSLRTRIPEVGIHTYTRTANGVEGALDMIARFRQTLTAAGMEETPMLADEFGWYTSPQSGLYFAPESVRATLIAGTASTFWRTNCGVTGMAPYAWITAEINQSDPENWYGLASTWTGEPHPSGTAYAGQIQLALGKGSTAPPTDTLAICPSTSTAPSPDSSPGPSPDPLEGLQNLLPTTTTTTTPAATTDPAAHSAAGQKAKKKKKKRKHHRKHHHKHR